jgi:hypothetical protein
MGTLLSSVMVGDVLVETFDLSDENGGLPVIEIRGTTGVKTFASRATFDSDKGMTVALSPEAIQATVDAAHQRVLDVLANRQAIRESVASAVAASASKLQAAAAAKLGS